MTIMNTTTNTTTIPAKRVAGGLISEKAYTLANQAYAALNELYWLDEMSKSGKKAIFKAMLELDNFVSTEVSDEDPFADPY